MQISLNRLASPADDPGGDQLGSSLSPIALVRVAALPLDSMEALVPTETFRTIEQLVACEANLATHGAFLSEALYRAVQAASCEQRPAVLNVRRAVHAGKSPRPLTDPIRETLSPAVCERLQHWEDERRRRDDLQRRAEDLLVVELTETRRAVARVAQDPAFGLSHALLAIRPELVQQLRKATDAPEATLPSRLEGPLLSYWTRGAAKTSPFGQLMFTGALELEDAPTRSSRPLIVGPPSARVRVSRGLLVQAARALWLEEVAQGQGRALVNSTIRRLGDGRVMLIAQEPTIAEGRLWRAEELMPLYLPEVVVTVLEARRGDICELPRLVEELQGTAGPALLRQLAETGVLLPPPWTDAEDERPEVSFSARFQKSGADLSDARAGDLRSSIASVIRSAAALETASGDARLQAALDVRAASARAWEALGEEAPPGDPGAFEDGVLPPIQGGPSLDRNVLSAVVADQVRARLQVDPAFALASERFCARFGVGGTCRDVVAFLMELCHAAPNPRATLRPEEIPAWSRGELAIGTTVFAQPLGGNTEASAVVNTILNGHAWLTARFSDLPTSSGAPAARALGAWLHAVEGGPEPVDIWSRGDLLGLQAHPRITRRVLSWPLEPCRDRTGSVPLERCTLHHDADSGLLNLRDPDGRPIVPRYLGSVSDVALGPVRMLLALGRPLVYPRESDAPPAGRVQISVDERIVDRGVVMRRRRWWLRNSYLLGTWFARTGVQRLKTVWTERARLGMPARLFVRPHLPPEWDRLAAMGSQRKPMFIDLRAPLTLDLLASAAQRSHWLIAEEMLPDADQLAARVQDRLHVCELQLDLAVRSKGGIARH